jgi:Vitamin K-dependent gamma-carboxylase
VLVKGWLARWQTETGDVRVLALARVGIGVLLFWQCLDLARELARDGYFGDAFHMPFLPEAFVPSSSVYKLTLAARLLLGALVAIGTFARPALFASAVLGGWALLCDRVHFHHNRYALLCFAFLLAFSPCDRALSIISQEPPGPSVERPRIGALWAQRLAGLQLSIIYLASGGSKLLDADWRGGLVIGDRFARYGGQALDRGVPARLVEVLSQPAATSAIAKLAIATELFLAFGLWSRRTRVFALWLGLAFHLTIELTSNVELFTLLSLTIYVLFATPDFRARKLHYDPSRRRGKILARLVGALDWLARFEIRAWEPDGLRKGHTLVIVRRDGTRATGIRALAMVARCVPLLFPLWLPLALVASFTRGGGTSARS